MIEVVRKDQSLRHAVEYFAGEKVVASEFKIAKKLQLEKDIHDIVTEEGTEFKHGMISGG